MLDILGFGNAIVDLTAAETATGVSLPQMFGAKGGFFRTSEEEFTSLLASLSSYQANAGGSVCNSLKTLAVLGAGCGFVGRCGNDELAVTFREDLRHYNIADYVIISPQGQSACTIVLVAPDGEKTICGKMRAAKNIEKKDIDFALIASAKMIFVEGYWLDHKPELTADIIRFAKDNGVITAFTLSDPKIVRENEKILEQMIGDIDIILGNEHEFAALGNISLSDKIAAKTLGKDGVDLFFNNKWSHYLALKVENIVNTNGAGDAFAGGFLFALLKGESPEKAIDKGQKCSCHVLQRQESTMVADFDG